MAAETRPIKTINLNHTRYGLKHIAEKEIGYIPNGVFDAAAIIAGYPYRRVDQPNATFGMSERSIKEQLSARLTSPLTFTESTSKASLGTVRRCPQRRCLTARA